MAFCDQFQHVRYSIWRYALVRASRSGKRPNLSPTGLPAGLVGYVIECLVDVYALVSARGRLTSARPTSDMDHKDFIFDVRGYYANIYVQVKGLTGVDRQGVFRTRVDYVERHILSDPRLIYVFCRLDPRAIRLTRIWVISARDFNRLAPHARDKRGRVRLLFHAGRSGKWSAFEIEPSDLGPRLLKVIGGLETKYRSAGQGAELSALGEQRGFAQLVFRRSRSVTRRASPKAA